MGIIFEKIWECKNCGFRFKASDGIYEPNLDYADLVMSISPMYCNKCGNVKHVKKVIAVHNSIQGCDDLPADDSDICEHCNTKMKLLRAPIIKFLQIAHKCPKCNKKTFVFKGYGHPLMT